MISVSGKTVTSQKHTINKIFDLPHLLDTISLHKKEIQKSFLPNTEKLALDLLQKYQILDPVIVQLKFWHKYKTQPIKAKITILRNKSLLRFFRKLNKTTRYETTDILEQQYQDTKVPCLPLNLIKNRISYKRTCSIRKKFEKVQCIDCNLCQINKLFHAKNK